MKFVLGVLALLCVWILLMESVSLGTIASGLVFSVFTWLFCNSALPLGKISNVSVIKLAMYPFYLIGQVYLAGFYVVKLVFTQAQVEILPVTTHLTNESLRTILVDSITLTPGSIMVQPSGKQFTILWLKGKAEAHFTQEEKEEAIKGKLERWLIKAQKE